MSFSDEVVKWTGVLCIGAMLIDSAASSFMNAVQDKDALARRIKNENAPDAKQRRISPLLGGVPRHPKIPTGTIVIDFMRTRFLSEQEKDPSIPMVSVCIPAMQRIQFDILGLTPEGGLDMAYRMQFRWRNGLKHGDSMTSFPRPFNIIFHDPKQPEKEGIAFAVMGFDMNKGKVNIGAYDRKLPTMYFTPNDQVTLIYCSAANASAALLRDPNIYSSSLGFAKDVRREEFYITEGRRKKVLPAKRVGIPNNMRHRTYSE